MGKTIGRRSLLLNIGTVGAGALLAACGPATPDQPVKPGVAAPTQAPGSGAAPAATSAPAGGAATAAPASGGAPATPAAGAAAAVTKPASAAGGQAPPAASGTRIVDGQISDASILNPVLSTDTSSGRVTGLLFSALVTVSPKDGSPVPDLAESWSASEDGLTYTFKLRKGVKFHDGKELTADDVKFTFDTVFDPEVNSPRRSTLLEALDGPDSVTVKDPYTVEYKLKQQYAPFLVQVMIRPIVPKHLLGDKKGKDFNSADFNTKSPVGTGPFKFKEWVKDSYILLEANKDYFKGAPKIDQYIYKVVKDQVVAGAQAKTGEVDLTVIDPSQLNELEKASNLTVNKYDTLSFVYYAYNLDKAKTELFQEKEVRQALVYALDRKAMADAILFGQGVPADSIYPLASWAYDPKDNPQYNYDPNKAKQMLDAAGWKPGADGIRQKNGKKLAFTIYTNAGNKVREAFIGVLQEQWKAVGVAATPKTEDFTALLNRFNKTKDFEVLLIGFSWGVDPDESTMWSTKGQQGGFNTNGYSNPKVDELLAQGLKETNKDKRKAIYKQVDKLVLDDLPSPILVFQKNLLAVNKRVKGVEPNAFNLLHNVETWTVS